MLLRRFVRPDGTQQPARSKWRVKTRSGARGDLGGTRWGPWSVGVRSFDAPGRAGTVTYQDCIAVSSSGGRACGVEVRPMGARKGRRSEQRGGVADGVATVMGRTCGGCKIDCVSG